MKIVFATFGVKLATSLTITDLRWFEAPKIRRDSNDNKIGINTSRKIKFVFLTQH